MIRAACEREYKKGTLHADRVATLDVNHVVVTAVCPAADGLFYQSAGPGTLLGGACLFLENALMLEKRSS